MRTRTSLLISLCTAGVLLAPGTASAYVPHTVAGGESLYSVAAADGLSVSQLAAANGLSSSSQLRAGATLLIPSAGSAAVAPVATTATSGDGDGDGDDLGGTAAPQTSSVSSAPASRSVLGGYVVQPGDTLSAIAARAGVPVSALAAANGLDPNGLLIAGRALRVSGVSSGSGAMTSSGTSAAVSQPVGASAQGSPSGGPYPTPERVSPSEVGSIASSEGVPPSLAAAIGYQESGFNNDLVSSADARGVMQILPGTWNWIQHSLSVGQPLSPYSAADNVRGGVLLLRSLLHAAGGDPAVAAAGYYQGLPSVRAHGLYRDTQSYVNNVLALRQRFGG